MNLNVSFDFIAIKITITENALALIFYLRVLLRVSLRNFLSDIPEKVSESFRRHVLMINLRLRTLNRVNQNFDMITVTFKCDSLAYQKKYSRAM